MVVGDSFDKILLGNINSIYYGNDSSRTSFNSDMVNGTYEVLGLSSDKLDVNDSNSMNNFKQAQHIVYGTPINPNQAIKPTDFITKLKKTTNAIHTSIAKSVSNLQGFGSNKIITNYGFFKDHSTKTLGVSFKVSDSNNHTQNIKIIGLNSLSNINTLVEHSSGKLMRTAKAYKMFLGTNGNGFYTETITNGSEINMTLNLGKLTPDQRLGFGVFQEVYNSASPDLQKVLDNSNTKTIDYSLLKNDNSSFHTFLVDHLTTIERLAYEGSTVINGVSSAVDKVSDFISETSAEIHESNSQGSTDNLEDKAGLSKERFNKILTEFREATVGTAKDVAKLGINNLMVNDLQCGENESLTEECLGDTVGFQKVKKVLESHGLEGNIENYTKQVAIKTDAVCRNNAEGEECLGLKSSLQKLANLKKDDMLDTIGKYAKVYLPMLKETLGIIESWKALELKEDQIQAYKDRTKAEIDEAEANRKLAVNTMIRRRKALNL